MMTKDKLYIVIPAYNESENIKNVINDWYPVVEKHDGNGGSRLLIINDGSTDNTLDIIKQCEKEKNLLQSLTKPNSGHGPTILYGYKYAIDHGADYVFQTDSDGQTEPAEFDTFWELRKAYNIVLGNRTNRGDGVARAFVEKMVCFLLRLYFGVKVPDANAPFRLMDASVLAKYVGRLPDNYNLPNIMLTTYFVYYKENVTFQEITFKPRQGGVNSINIKKIGKIGINALKDFQTLKKDMD